ALLARELGHAAAEDLCGLAVAAGGEALLSEREGIAQAAHVVLLDAPVRRQRVDDDEHDRAQYQAFGRDGERAADLQLLVRDEHGSRPVGAGAAGQRLDERKRCVAMPIRDREPRPHPAPHSKLNSESSLTRMNDFCAASRCSCWKARSLIARA